MASTVGLSILTVLVSSAKMVLLTISYLLSMPTLLISITRILSPVFRYLVSILGPVFFYCTIMFSYPVAVCFLPINLALVMVTGLLAATISICQSLARTTIMQYAPARHGYVLNWMSLPLSLVIHQVRHLYTIPSVVLIGILVCSVLYAIFVVPIIFMLFWTVYIYFQRSFPFFVDAFNLVYRPLWMLRVDSVISCMPKKSTTLRSSAIGFLASMYWYSVTCEALFIAAETYQIYMVWSTIRHRARDALFTAIINSRMVDILAEGMAAARTIYCNICSATWSLLQLLYTMAPPNTLDMCIALGGIGIRLILWSASQTDIVTNVFLEALNNLQEDSLSEAKSVNNSVYQSLPPLEHGGKYVQGRLLELQPGSGNKPIVCTLGIMELGHPDGKPYEALSYVWGTSPWTSRVKVNGKNFVISITLHRILLHLRRESAPRALWIDALCINQADLAERSSQVLLMPSLYSNAVQAIVWLGHDEPLGLKNTFQYMNLPSQDGAKDNDRLHYGSSRAVAQILQNDYWTRTWVIQEVVLAKSAVVQCGNSALAWGRFCDLAHASAQHSFFPVKSTHFDKFEDLNDIRTSRLLLQNDLKAGPRKSRCSRATMARPENSMDLLSLCYRFRFRKSTDPRDKVFAFLGLSDVSKRLLKVDYSRRQSFLCIELSKRHVCHSRSLSVVALAESMRPQSTLESPSVGTPDYIPSWCPSFFRSDGWFDDNRHLLWTGLPSEETAFSATGCTPISVAPEYQNSQEETTNNHSSFHLMKVHVLPEFSAKITHDGRFDDPNDEALNKTFRIDETLHATLRSINGQILPAERALSKEAVQLRKSTDPYRASHHRAALLDQDMSADELLHLTLTAGKFLKFPTAVANSSRGQYHQARRDVYSGRRLFVTGNGHLGLGPEGLKNGDELHLVLGMDVPVILRPALSEWKHLGTPYEPAWVYVGQAYVHEMMRYKGDLVEDIRRSKVKLEERVLV